MDKKAIKDALKRAKDRAEREVRSNYTFRLPGPLMKELQAKCKREGVKPTWVLEELIVEFLKE